MNSGCTNSGITFSWLYQPLWLPQFPLTPRFCSHRIAIDRKICGHHRITANTLNVLNYALCIIANGQPVGKFTIGGSATGITVMPATRINTGRFQATGQQIAQDLGSESSHSAVSMMNHIICGLPSPIASLNSHCYEISSPLKLRDE